MKIKGYDVETQQRRNRIEIKILEKNIVVFRHNVSNDAFEKHECEILDSLKNVLDKRNLLIDFLIKKGFKNTRKNTYEIKTNIDIEKYKIKQNVRVCLPIINHVRKKTIISQQYDYIFIQFLFDENVLYKKTYIFKTSKDDILNMPMNNLFEKYFEIEKIKNGL